LSGLLLYHKIRQAIQASTSAIIDATANAHKGKITSELPINIVDNGNGAHAYGPFNPAIPTDEKTAPRLTLIATLGNISIHKMKIPQNGP
jgi:hypothetical protein